MANTNDKVWDIVAPVAEKLGLSIWDVRYVKEGASWFLRIFIDKEGGISIEDCETFSRAIDKPLDDADPIKESYYLEVSSPGLNRELTRKEHFEKYIGEEIAIKLIRPVEGNKIFIGKLESFDNNEIKIENNIFKLNETSKICLCDDRDLI